MDYRIAFIAARVNAGVLACSAALAADAATPFHPSWLSTDLGLTFGVIAGLCGAVATVLPQVQRTPGARETAYVAAATFGTLPPDLADKHPELAVAPPLAVVPPAVPPQPPPATVP